MATRWQSLETVMRGGPVRLLAWKRRTWLRMKTRLKSSCILADTKAPSQTSSMAIGYVRRAAEVAKKHKAFDLAAFVKTTVETSKIEEWEGAVWDKGEWQGSPWRSARCFVLSSSFSRLR